MGSKIQSQLQDLRDLELALLISLVSEQHCIVSTGTEGARLLPDELRWLCLQTFRVQPALVYCSPDTTVDQFSESVLVDSSRSQDDEDSAMISQQESHTSTVTPDKYQPRRLAANVNILDNRKIAEVVIAVGLDTANIAIQTQAFELIRTKRVFTRSAMHVASKGLLFIAVLSHPAARLSHHLNDEFSISHYHAAEEGFRCMDAELDMQIPFSVDHEDIKFLRRLFAEVQYTAELAQYIHNVVVFMRTSRYVQGGVTATATRQFRTLCRALAPLHNLDYVPPYLVALAARKVYPHRLILVTPQTERSLQWGSDPAAIKNLLAGLTVEDVIEEVLSGVEAPL